MIPILISSSTHTGNPTPAMTTYYTGDAAAILLSEPIPTTIALKVADQYEAKVPGWTADKRYSISSGPIGLAIGLRTGTIRWTPTPNQVGTHPVVISDGAGGTMSFSIVVVANPAFTDDLSIHGWVSNVGTGAGTLASPAIDLRAFRGTKVGTTYNSTKPIVYLRGGCYPRGSENRRMAAGERAVRDIDLNNVEIRAWGNERVTLRVGENPVRLVEGCSNVVFDSLEIRGDSDKFNYLEAIDAWWSEPSVKSLNSNGMALAGTGVTVMNCVVHEVLCQGVAFKSCTDAIIENTIVANSARWTISGTTGIGMVGMLASEKPVTEHANIIRGCLIYGVESRIYSHVFAKGMSHLSIDEGEGLLCQTENNTGLTGAGYMGRFLLENNCLMYTGKGIVANTANNMTVRRNTIYNSGTTMAGRFKGLRSNKGSNGIWENNLVQTFAGAINDLGTGYSFAHIENADGTPANGYIMPQRQNNYMNVNDDPNEDGAVITPNLFTNPSGNDPTPHPSIPQGIGADANHHLALMEKARSYSVQMTPDPYWQTMNYPQQTKDIISRLPAGLTADYSDWHDTVPYVGSDGKLHDEFDLPITGQLAANGLPDPFKLIVVWPFVGA